MAYIVTVPQANHIAPFARWQSAGTPVSGPTTLRALVYGVSTAGLVIGGSLVYANYNPSFRNKADEYVPGFARLADFAADKWVNVSATVKPTSVDKVGLKKDLGSKLDLKLSNPTLSPSVVISEEETPKSKQSYSIKASDKDESMLHKTLEATTDKEAGAPPPSLSTEEFIDTATKYATGLTDGDSVQQSSQHMKEEHKDKNLAIVQKIPVESQPEMLTEVVSNMLQYHVHAQMLAIEAPSVLVCRLSLR